jgi:hypothetical protein
MQTIGNMTLDELKRVIRETVADDLTAVLGALDLEDEAEREDNVSWDEIRALADRHRWTPPPGAKSSLELLREDRER